MDKKRKIFIFLLIFSFFLLQGGRVFALELTYPPIFGISLNSASTFPEYARYFFNIGLALAVFAALIMIAFGGISYLFTLGVGKLIDPIKGKRAPDEAKERVKAGILGLMIVMCAYLIAYTINPDLVVFRLDQLSPIFSSPSLFNPNGKTPTYTYEEIPIGILTENLLSRTSFCYEFDYNGDPIPMQARADNGQTFPGPTYDDHDRIDCLQKLMEGAEKKSEEINRLAKEIARLMQTCHCSGTNCKTEQQNFCTIANPNMKICPDAGRKINCWPINPQANNPTCCSDETWNKIKGNTKMKIGCDNVEIRIEDFVNWNDESFTNPSDKNSAVCVVKSSGYGTIKTKRDIVIGSGINKEYVQWAANEWNKAVGKEVFGSVVANNTLVNSRCFPIAYTAKCSDGSTDYFSKDFIRIYNRKIDEGGTFSWDLPGINFFNTMNGEIVSDIDIDLKSGPIIAHGEHGIKMTILHELGHSLGLADSYNTTDGTANPDCNYKSVMNNHWIMDGVGESDISALRSLYSFTSLFIKNSFIAGLANAAIVNNAGNDCCSEKEYDGLKEFNVKTPDVMGKVEKKVTINKKTVMVIDIEKWKKLTLADQLTYFKQKISNFQAKLEKDNENLKNAEQKLSQCYLAKSYYDYLKVFEETKKEDKEIKKINTFVDPETNEKVSVAKYCKGFTYYNSEAYHFCNNLCPGYTEKDKNCYKKISACDDRQDPAERQSCLEEQEKETKECYDNRQCNPGVPFGSFEKCISAYKDDCNKQCLKIYPECSDEYAKCVVQCSADSQCLLTDNNGENEGKCLMNFQSLKKCADVAGDGAAYSPTDFKNCAESAATCQYCSSQNAGYPDCVNSGTQYSSSYLYKNPANQVCPSFSQTCVQQNPEIAKCPTQSQCPACPCGKIYSQVGGGGGGGGGNNICTIPGTCPDPNDPNNPEKCSMANCNGNGGGGGGGGTMPVPEAYRVCTGQCGELNYNDDPLTFYCPENWWFNENETLEKNDRPIGQDYQCSQKREIPVGQTVDNAEAWGKTILDYTNAFTAKLDDMLKYVKEIGAAAGKNNYCKCDSACKNNKRICVSECKQVPKLDQDGRPIFDENGNQEKMCKAQPCAGNPCQQMINRLMGKLNQGVCTADNYNGVAFYVGQIASALSDFIKNVIAEGRSDIVKELEYSRQKVNECSTKRTSYGDEAKFLNCERAENNIDPLVRNFDQKTIINGTATPYYCYGKKLNPSFMDNWFCCEKIEK